jgi:coproporphyrinogen III oxidase
VSFKKSKSFVTFEKLARQQQSLICSAINKLDPVDFVDDDWQFQSGGGGLSKVLVDGDIFEKAGVNVSSIEGKLSPEMSRSLFIEEGAEFHATGISLVLHPQSPRIPTVHLNIRCFELENQALWYGGGIDLTPYYPHDDDFIHFHQVLEKACNSIKPDSYQSMKNKCDDYFSIPHRHEMRGIGGVFFDHLNSDSSQDYELCKAVSGAIIDAYMPIVSRRQSEPYTQDDKDFQLIRRGRYVEFNLMYDRGTSFGLKSNGRTESILMSLPPVVNYKYNWQPPRGSKDEKMTTYYQPHDWLTH